MKTKNGILGIWEGEIRDTTSVLSTWFMNEKRKDRLTLAVNDVRGTKIEGEIRTRGIIPGGEFRGTFADGKIFFTTKISESKSVHWTGELMDNGELHGNWQKDDQGIVAKVTGGWYFAGYWSCKK